MSLPTTPCLPADRAPAARPARVRLLAPAAWSATTAEASAPGIAARLARGPQPLGGFRPPQAASSAF